MQKKLWAIAGVAVIVIAGTYWYSESTGKKETAALDTQSIKQLVHEFSSRSAKAESASISSTQLIVENAGSSLTYRLPKDEFFVSIAPYLEKSHPCATHNLVGCQGELAEQEFSVTVQDSEGNAVMDKKIMKSQPNGFIDLWLPRDQTYRVTIEQNGKIAKSEVSTYQENDTCVTTMQLG
ncbi:CueP family metal-binding protein [Paenibacillus sp. HW567]|uniref:CueP family metal-binding protein n=1 Tax=Paenibacillus sp. HW567 TaxID=1034769 RepID=UPI0003762943|nr:CueP family metal-binding protein [Paenibacillus sp. HW567]